MKRLALVCAMALATAVAASGASASPVSNSIGGLSKQQSGIELAKFKRHGGVRGHRNFGHRNFGRRNFGHRGPRFHHFGGNRYAGWHRYYSRPYNWRTRGCVVIGPIWFCP